MSAILHHCRRHITTLWGQRHFVTPRLVDWIHGDGKKLIWYEPMATRPDYYIARIDSKVDTDNCGKPPVFCDEVLEDLLSAIEDQYGRAWERWEHDNGRTYERHNLFPALSDDCGSSWGTLTILKSPTNWTEWRVRRELKRRRR